VVVSEGIVKSTGHLSHFPGNRGFWIIYCEISQHLLYLLQTYCWHPVCNKIECAKELKKMSMENL
jgi:hypothetical protein